VDDNGRDDRLDAGVDDGDHVVVVPLVLGRVDAQRRAQMAEHLLRCATCRREYDEMAATVNELLPAVPAVQPPLGFDQQVLARMGISRPARRRAPRLGWLAGAAAAIVVVIAAISWWTTASDDTESAGQVAALELVNGGDNVGTVSVGDVEGETVMVVALVSAPDGVSYKCRTTFADGTTTESEPWESAYGAWIVPVPDTETSDDETVELIVDGTDHVWSTATFDTTDT
jgi:hypothetical protein